MLRRGRAVGVGTVQVSEQLLRDEGPQLVSVGDVEGVQIAVVGGGEDRGVVDVRARRGAAVDDDRGLRMQRVAHGVALLGRGSVGVVVLQVLAASVVDGVVVRCRGADAQYRVGDEGVRGRHRSGVARGEIDGVSRRRIGSDIGVEFARAGVRRIPIRYLARGAACGHSRSVGGRRPEALGAVLEEAGGGIHGRDGVLIHDDAVLHGVFLDVAGPVIRETGLEDRDVQIAQRLRAVESVHRYRRRGERRAGLQDVAHDVRERRLQPVQIAGLVELPAARRGDFGQPAARHSEPRVVPEADRVELHVLLPRHAREQVGVEHVLRERGHAFAGLP